MGAGWSNPCFEIWMYAYFGEMPVIMEFYTCCNRFAKKFERVTGQKYSKNNRDIYRKLVQFVVAYLEMKQICEFLSQPDNLDKEIIGLSYQLEIENCEDVVVIRMESMKRFVLDSLRK